MAAQMNRRHIRDWHKIEIILAKNYNRSFAFSSAVIGKTSDMVDFIEIHTFQLPFGFPRGEKLLLS